MLKILGFFVGVLFTVWAFNKYIPQNTQQNIIEATDVVITEAVEKIQNVNQQSTSDSQEVITEDLDNGVADTSQMSAEDTTTGLRNESVTYVITPGYATENAAKRVIKELKKKSAFSTFQFGIAQVEHGNYAITILGSSQQDADNKWQIFESLNPSLALKVPKLYLVN